jgi:hypothetical protein
MKKQLIKEAFRLQQLAGIAPINEILPSNNTPRRKGLQKEQNGATKTYYTVNRYGVTEIVPYKSLGFDGSEQWEELSGFDSNIIKKYYTDNDGTGKVVVNANTSEDEMLADLERIDDDMWMESAKPGMQKKGTMGMQKEQNGATKTYYTVNTYGVTEIKPYEAFGFDGTEEWEEVEFEFPSSIIKKYYTTEDGVGKVVADANASEDEVLIDLEEIDTDLFY